MKVVLFIKALLGKINLFLFSLCAIGTSFFFSVSTAIYKKKSFWKVKLEKKPLFYVNIIALDLTPPLYSLLSHSSLHDKKKKVGKSEENAFFHILRRRR